jgi:hypothetical protein
MPRFRRRRPHQPDDYPPASLRQRVVVAAAAVVVSVVVGLALLAPQLRLMRAKARPPPDRPPCSRTDQNDCVGGTMAIRVVPPTPAERRPVDAPAGAADPASSAARPAPDAR